MLTISLEEDNALMLDCCGSLVDMCGVKYVCGMYMVCMWYVWYVCGMSVYHIR